MDLSILDTYHMGIVTYGEHYYKPPTVFKYHNQA